MGKKRKKQKKGAEGREPTDPEGVAVDARETTDPEAKAPVAAETSLPEEPTPVVAHAEVSAAAAAAKPAVRPDTDRPTSGSDRRLFRRVPFFRKVQYKFATIDEFKSRFANDLSLGGMFIRTDEPEPMGTVIFLEFDLQDGSKILTGYGKVVRVNPKDQPGFDPGMGIEFLKFDEESLQRIRALVSDQFT